MSFASDMKKELALIIPEKKCCLLAEIAGFLRMNGSIRLMGGGKLSVIVTSEDPAVARMMKKLIKIYFDADTSLEIISGSGIRKVKHYRLTFNDMLTGEQVLRETGMLTVQEGSNVITDGIAPEIIRKKCCKRAYLRGLFLASGSVNHPERGYHLELVGRGVVMSSDIKKLMNSFSLNAKISERRDHYVIYIKESEKIVDFMNIVGAHNRLFEYENIRIIRDMRNRTNRIVNCESANMDKSVNAAARQIENIRYLDERIGIDTLPEKLRTAALSRMENPELPLRELAALIDPPVSKSGLNHRLAKLDDMADSIREQDGLKSEL